MVKNPLLSLLSTPMGYLKKGLFFVVIVATLSACNTIQGIGKDIEKSGEAIQQSAK
jgi:predicted small secreted protein